MVFYCHLSQTTQRLWDLCPSVLSEKQESKLYTRCTYLQCMPQVHCMTFEPTGDTCALLLVGVASAFVTIGHVQQV